MATTNKRFQTISQILFDAAQGNETAFGGLRLWELSRDELLEAELHGIRLISPQKQASGGSCCGSTQNAVLRSETSPLIRGLRGQSPFDGSQFPSLPWGEKSLSKKNIAVIAEWIDDDCPDDNQELAVFETTAAKKSLVQITGITRLNEEVREVFEVSPNEYKFQKGELKQRMNFDCMTESQIEKVRYVLREMYELNKWAEDIRNYNNLALIHQNHCQHGWERFLPWHRVYLYEFEQAMQDILPEVTMPYWDWTMPQYHPLNPATGRIIPDALKAFLTDASLIYLKKQDIPADKLKPLVGKLFATQTDFFDEVKKLIGVKYTKGEYRHRFIDALLDANSLWYPLRYPAQFGGKTINQAIHYHYPSPDDIEQLLSLRTFRDFGGGSLYNDSFGFIDQNPHNTMHIWTGGENPEFKAETAAQEAKERGMEFRNKTVLVAGRKFHKREDLYSQPQFGDMFSNLTASYDPIFWCIHTNVDRLWWEWQQRHPDSNPADLDAVLTPWSYTTRDTLDMYRFGYEYVKCAFVLPVGAESPVGRFVSKQFAVSEKVRSAFKTAEVRLHRVPQLHRSCFIRVFLNLPDADANTSIEHENYAGYLAIFGHGTCYGGPGHCEPPPARRREYDLRPRNHNTPRNHRIDVTKAARRLFENGAESLQITLVVIGVDYREDNELLRLEGISLNFLD